MILRMIVATACLAVLGCLVVGAALFNPWLATLIPVVVGVGVVACPNERDGNESLHRCPGRRWT